MKKVAAVFASALMSVSMAGFATPEAGDKSFSISGTGASDKDFDGNAYGVSGELGFYATEHLLWGVRQSFNGLVGDDVNDSWNGSTRGFVDYHFGSGDARPYIGANIGGIYGENTKDTGIAGLEAGVRWFVQEKTFIGFGMEYAYLFDDSDDIDSSFDDGAFFYTLGVGFNF
tara:strand:+ start:2906 stop:3421 length:516 start_codon:yes stop_codon:yes gene_type:complete